MKLTTIILSAAIALAPVLAKADDSAAACTTGDPVSLLLETAKAQSVEVVVYKDADFTKYVDAVRALFPTASGFGNGADTIIEALLDKDTVAVFLASNGCLIARGAVSRTTRDAVVQQAGLSK